MEGTSASSAAPPTPPLSPDDAADGPEQLKPFDEEALRNLVIERDWNAVEEELKQILPVKKKGEDHANLHPDLFLPVYQEWIEDLIRKNEGGAAFKVFVDKAAKVYKAEGEFLVDKENLKIQVNRLHSIANEKVKLLSPPTKAEKICTALIDYLDLYFPDLTGHSVASEGYNHLWRFAKRLDKPKGQKDPNFKCLACGTEFKNCTISKMRKHLNIEAGGKICEKITDNMWFRFKDGETKKNWPR